MAEDKTRVDFNAPESLVREADVVSDLLDTSRTNLLVEGLRKQLSDVESDEGFQRRLRDAYYAGRIEFDTVAAVVGTEEAMRMKLLRESMDREPPLPSGENVEIPTDEAFYDGEVPTWTPESGAEADARSNNNQ
jgi:hypothetical protein